MRRVEIRILGIGVLAVSLVIAGLDASAAPEHADARERAPKVLLSTLIGGWDNEITAVAVDPQGRVYVAGNSDNNGTWPTTAGAYREEFAGMTDGFVARLSPDGSQLEYATFLGGGGTDTIADLAVDRDGHAVVVGETASYDFPRTPGSFRPDGGNVFVTKLSEDGSALEYSTLFGVGSFVPEVRAVEAAPGGQVWVTGKASHGSVPPTPDAYVSPRHGSYADAFVMKISPSGHRLIFSSIVGGSGADYSNAIDVNSDGVFIGGNTDSSDFPTTRGVPQPELAGETDGFVAQLSSDGSRLVRSTLYGGTESDAVGDVEAAPSGLYATAGGYSRDLPTTTGAFQRTRRARISPAPIVLKLDADTFSVRYATFLTGTEPTNGLAHDTAYEVGVIDGEAVVAGVAQTNLPTTPAALYPYREGRADGFIAKLSRGGEALTYSTRLGGGGAYDLDVLGDSVYVAGVTSADRYPTTADAFQRSADCAYGCGFVTGFGL